MLQRIRRHVYSRSQCVSYYSSSSSLYLLRNTVKHELLDKRKRAGRQGRQTLH